MQKSGKNDWKFMRKIKEKLWIFDMQKSRQNK